MTRRSQLTIAEVLKVEGIDRVARHNEDWLDRVRREAMRIDSIRGQVSSADLREWADSTGDHPNHKNAWGAVFRGREWVPVGWTKSRHPDGHARTIRLWSYRGRPDFRKR